jgi:ATP-GRASP peptide maturase of grasp-with-spasm system
MKVLILSTSNDYTTNKVIKWLQYLRVDFARYNLDDNINLCDINIDEFTAYWYRKGNLLTKRDNPFFSNEVEQYLFEYNKKIIQYIEFKLSKKRHLNLFFNVELNKLIVLEEAKSLGLLIPNFRLFDNTEQIEESFKIYKTINEQATIYDSKNNSILSALTQEHKETGNTYSFSPTLFQEKIEKKYEIRTFYLDGLFFSMAIFSQKTSQTSLDYRNYNHNFPNRTVSFKLPLEIENKLDVLMKKFNLKSGAIDLIVNPENDYYFLEINPVGQFGMISNPCNYYIEKEIINYFTNGKEN